LYEIGASTMLKLLKKIFEKAHHEHNEGLPLNVPETLNLDTYSLGKTKIGQPPHPEDSFNSAEPILWIKNPEQGIELGVQHNSLEFVFLTIETYKSAITYNGTTTHLTPDITIAEFIKQFGEPYFYNKETKETILFYEPLPGLIEIQAEFTNGKLAFLLITSEALLADEEQRKAFEINKPWPPKPTTN